MRVNIPEKDLQALRFLRHWIEQHIGIIYKDEADPILYSRLLQLCWKEKLKDLNDLHLQLSNGRMPNLSLKIAQSVSTTHTHFFREVETFEYFNQVIFPTIKQEPNIRIWSAAASSGEEAFTLAIYMAENLGIQTASQRVQILGTDINLHVVRQAEHGIYHEDRLKDVPSYLKIKYFKPIGMGQYQVIPELRNMCTFRRMNLQSESWPFKKLFHTVFCRNVLYYFKPEQQAYVINNIYNHTTPQSYLLTSLTESLTQLNTPWNMVKPAIYNKNK